MPTTVNNISVYETKVNGTRTEYVRVSAVDVVPADKTSMDTWETATASVAGTQVVRLHSVVDGSTLTGFVDDTTAYTCTLKIDGTEHALNIAGEDAQTYTALIAQIEAVIGANGTVTIDANKDLLITSDASTGKTSHVEIVDDTTELLFSKLTGFVEILEPVNGGLSGYLKTQTLANGANAWGAFKHAVEIYDTGADETLVENDLSGDVGTANGALQDVTATPDQTIINNNFSDLVERVNALQALVYKNVLHK